jgi:hypothetical protein
LYGLPEWKGFSQKLRDFSEEQKAEFWASSHQANSKQKLQTLMEESMVTRQTEVSEASSQGGYYPLSWYKAQAFSTKAIKEKCTDTRDHSIFGQVYRAKIDFIKDGNVSEKIHEKAYKKQDPGESSSSSGLQNSGVDPSGAVPLPTDPKSLSKQRGVAQKVLTKLGSISAPLQLTLKHKASNAKHILCSWHHIHTRHITQYHHTTHTT